MVPQTCQLGEAESFSAEEIFDPDKAMLVQVAPQQLNEEPAEWNGQKIEAISDDDDDDRGNKIIKD